MTPRTQRVIFNAAPEVRFDLPGAERVGDLLLAEFSSHPRFLGRHGYPHWLSVFDNARRLGHVLPDGSLLPMQAAMTFLASFLHDVGRLIPRSGQLAGLHHSARSEWFINSRLPGLRLPFSPEETHLIAGLARGHYRVYEQAHGFPDQWQWAEALGVTLCLQVVRDADALDRVRMSDFDPKFLQLKEQSCPLIAYVTEKWRCGWRPAEERS